MRRRPQDGLVGIRERAVEVDGVSRHGRKGHANIQGPEGSSEGISHPIYSRIIGQTNIVDSHGVGGHVDGSIGVIDQALLEID